MSRKIVRMRRQRRTPTVTRRIDLRSIFSDGDASHRATAQPRRSSPVNAIAIIVAVVVVFSVSADVGDSRVCHLLSHRRRLKVRCPVNSRIMFRFLHLPCFLHLPFLLHLQFLLLLPPSSSPSSTTSTCPINAASDAILAQRSYVATVDAAA